MEEKQTVESKSTQTSAYSQFVETEEQQKKRGSIFQMLLLPTVIYAVLHTILLYSNYSGIATPIFVVATICYINYLMKRQNVAKKPASKWYEITMLLLGISSFLTGNGFFITMNTVAFFLVLVCELLYNYTDTTLWSLGQYLGGLGKTLIGGFECVADFFSDATAYHKFKPERKNKTASYVLIGLVVAVPLLVIVVALLYSADQVFADVLEKIFRLKDWKIDQVVARFIYFVFVFAAAYCGMRFFGKKDKFDSRRKVWDWQPIIAITTLSLVAVVYLLFCGIQIIYLFGGKGAEVLPQGYTYAEYAREGFFQLLFVCVINVIMVLFVQRFFAQHRAIRLLLTVISLCTYVMIASSAYRMILYISEYHLTLLRVLVLWTLVVLAILLAGIIFQIYKNSFRLFTYGLVLVSVAYLLLSFSHVDYFIAKYNLAHQDKVAEAKMEAAGEYVDTYYLSGLSSDAAPAYAEVMEEKPEWLKDYKELVYTSAGKSVREFNLSKSYAYHLFYGKWFRP